MRFTDISIQALKPSGKQCEYYEQGSMGFHVRVTRRGVKTFAYRYSFGGKAKRITFGRYPDISLADAKTAAADAHNKVLGGIDPTEEQRKNKEKEKSAATIQNLIDLYINNHASYNNKSWESIKYTLNHYIPSDWKDRKAKSIERWEVFSFLEGIRNAGKGATCNRVRAFLKVMFEYAVERSILDASPLWGIKKMYKTTSRDRVLDNNEIKYFWNNIATVIKCSKVTELTLKTMLATGQRSGEVRHMKTEDLNYKNLIWTIPASISKNKKEHRVPLSPLAIELIREAYQLHKEHDYIFSSPVKPNEPMDRRAIARPVANFSKKGDIEKFTPHDLRRTFTTHCTRNGLRRDWIKYVLNHSEGDVTAVYDKYEYDDEKKSVLDAWAGILLEIINSGDEQEEEKTDVVNFLLVEKGE